MIRVYRDLRKLKSFEERYEYLKLSGVIGETTFGYDRCINQLFYKSKRWAKTRDKVIIRDGGCDLGVEGREIYGIILIHHMDPITIEDIELDRDEIYDPEFLICTSLNTHNAIHYGDESRLLKLPIDRKRNDTCPWH
jgi:5-methylcytosine-specific restriction endonuclease McrA